MTEWMVHGLIPKGHVVLLIGQPHSMKSWLAEHLGLCIASGSRFLNEFRVEAGSVIMIDEDTPSDTLDERLDRFTTAMSISITNLPFEVRSMRGFQFRDSDINQLVTDIQSLTPPVLIIIDGSCNFP